METMEIIIWSDNDSLECVSNIIHDRGYRTAEIRKEELGSYENSCNWSFCKLNMVDSICVDLNDAMGRIVPTDNVEEQPMYRYVAIFIIDDNDDDDTDTAEEEEQGEQEEMEKTTNVVMNIGMTTKDGLELNINSAIDRIGAETDCTITNTVGFYHGQRENSLKIDIYDIEIDRAVAMAGYFAHIFRQECVALTVGNTTVFVNDDYDENDFVKWCDALEK